MKTRMSVWMLGVLTVLAVGGLSPLAGRAQDAPKKDQLPPPQETPAVKQGVSQPGTIGEMTPAESPDYGSLSAQVEASIQRMSAMMARAQTLSKSFGDLAALHEGADRSEILMMQRMSDSMGSMAGEMKISLQQYKRLLEEETTTETGSTRANVESLRNVMGAIAQQIDEGLRTLQSLQGQLGQG